MATISRDQFDETKNVQKKVWQVGVPLMDADINEQNDIALERHRRAVSGLLARADTRFGTGFSITPHLTALTVYVLIGDAAFHLDDDHAALLNHPGTTELTGFASWLASGQRTDVVYIDIEEVEISPAEDPDIVNPLNAAETCRDIRLEYTISIANNTSDVPTPPAGHVYRPLARISKDGSSNQIVSDDIELLLPELGSRLAIEEMEVQFWAEASVSHGSFDAQGLENDDLSFVVSESAGGSKTNIVIKVPYAYDSAHNYLALRCQVKKNSFTTNAWVRLDGLGTTGTQAAIQAGGASETLEDVASYLEIPAGLTEGKVYELSVSLYGTSSILTEVWMFRPVITAGLGPFIFGQGGV